MERKPSAKQQSVKLRLKDDKVYEPTADGLPY